MTQPTDAQKPRPDAIELQLRIGLFLVQWLGAALVVYGVGYLVVRFADIDATGRSRALATAVAFLLLPGVVLFFTARSARRRMREEARSARLWSILSGVFMLLAALPLVTHWLGLAGAFVGLFTLTAGYLYRRDERARTEPR